MILAHRAALDGVQLDEIDPRIIIKGIEGGAGKESVSSAGTGSGDGSRITGKRREMMEIQVKFSMNIRRDAMAERAAVLEAVNAWAARCGWLTISYKPGRRIWIDEAVTPGEGDLWKRLSEYTIILRAYAVPFWQQTPAAASAVTTRTATDGSGTIAVAGSARTVADAVLANRSGATINTAEITVGGKKMRFESLALAANESLEIDHEITLGKNLIRIRIRNAAGAFRSALAKRTAGSADEFEIPPGDCAWSFSAQRACQLDLSVRGRFA